MKRKKKNQFNFSAEQSAEFEKLLNQNRETMIKGEVVESIIEKFAGKETLQKLTQKIPDPTVKGIMENGDLRRFVFGSMLEMVIGKNSKVIIVEEGNTNGNEKEKN